MSIVLKFNIYRKLDNQNSKSAKLLDFKKIINVKNASSKSTFSLIK